MGEEERSDRRKCLDLKLSIRRGGGSVYENREMKWKD
jgi:hypothetical protein